MDKEAADELVGGEQHDLLPRATFDAVILVFESDAVAVAGKQAAVGDGDAVGVARQIGQHGLGAAEGAFAVNRPFASARWRQILCERGAIREVGVRARELQAPGGVGGDELLQKQPAEQTRKHAHRNLPQPRPPVLSWRTSAACGCVCSGGKLGFSGPVGTKHS